MTEEEFTLTINQIGVLFDGMEFHTAVKIFGSILCTCVAGMPKKERVYTLNEIMKTVLLTLEDYDGEEDNIKIP